MTLEQQELLEKQALLAQLASKVRKALKGQLDQQVPLAFLGLLVPLGQRALLVTQDQQDRQARPVPMVLLVPMVPPDLQVPLALKEVLEQLAQLDRLETQSPALQVQQAPLDLLALTVVLEQLAQLGLQARPLRGQLVQTVPLGLLVPLGQLALQGLMALLGQQEQLECQAVAARLVLLALLVRQAQLAIRGRLVQADLLGLPEPLGQLAALVLHPQ